MRGKVVVVGGGIAGLWTALSFRKASPIVVAPKSDDEANTYWAQGGIAAALSPHDSPLLHYEDTLRAGGGFNDRKAALVLTHYGPMVVNKLMQMGFRFNEHPHLEGGHSTPRVWNVGDETGRVLLRFLRRKAEGRVEWRPGWVVSLLKEGDRVVGVRLADGSEIEADAVVLATGGYAALWERTTNPPNTLGRGLLMAAMAGAYLTDLEFVQFHPTVSLTTPPVLLTEALRGAGARLVNESGKDVVNPLLPRDIVARAVYNYRRRHGEVFLDLSRVDMDRFPVARRLYERFGERIPVSPAAHYSIGGVRTDVWGRTNVRGLWAVGECSATGAHGANRLASNSLLEGLVFGYRVALDVEEDVSQWPEFKFLREMSVEVSEGDEDIGALRGIMERYVGVERDAKGLREALNLLEGTGGIGNLARSIVEAALWREESRGVHYRRDHPSPSPEFSGRLGVRFRTIM
ncbi:MAG: FAD-binding protein [Thermotogae bacterium]|nr:FAD-binding protein [Thermotogota bacterium]